MRLRTRRDWPSAEDVFGAPIALRDSRRDLINRSESGSCRNEALERHSEALHIGRCGGRAVRHERDVFKIRLVETAVNRDQTSTNAQMQDSSGAQAGSTPAGRAERTVEAERRALTPPSTASQFTRDGRVIYSNQEERLGAPIERTITVSSHETIDCGSRRIVRRIVAWIMRSDPKSIVRDVSVCNPSHDLRHATGT